MIESDTVEEMRESVEEIDMSGTYIIDASLFSKSRRKYIKLINSDDENFRVKAKSNNEFEFLLEEPVYVDSVTLTVDDYIGTKGFRLVAIDILKDKKLNKSFSFQESGKSNSIDIECIISGFVIKAPSDIWIERKLKSVEVSGFERKDFDNLTDQLRKVESVQQRFDALVKEERSKITEHQEKLESDIQKHESRVLSLEESEEELQESIESLHESNEKVKLVSEELAVKKDKLSSEIDTLSARKSSLQDECQSLESSCEKERETLRSLNKDVSSTEAKLKKLVDNKNLFTEEFSSFVEQGKKQSIMYGFFAFIPILIFASITYLLFSGAVDLTTKYQSSPELDLMTVFVTRLPFVIIAITLASTGFALVKFLFNRIISIHKERLQFSKLAIIAKDVSIFSAEDLGISKEQQYEQRTFLKMQLLKAHLSENIENFQYQKKMPGDTGEELNETVENINEITEQQSQ